MGSQSIKNDGKEIKLNTTGFQPLVAVLRVLPSYQIDKVATSS